MLNEECVSFRRSLKALFSKILSRKNFCQMHLFETVAECLKVS